MHLSTVRLGSCLVIVAQWKSTGSSSQVSWVWFLTAGFSLFAVFAWKHPNLFNEGTRFRMIHSWNTHVPVVKSACLRWCNDVSCDQILQCDWTTLHVMVVWEIWQDSLEPLLLFSCWELAHEARALRSDYVHMCAFPHYKANKILAVRRRGNAHFQRDYYKRQKLCSLLHGMMTKPVYILLFST